MGKTCCFCKPCHRPCSEYFPGDSTGVCQGDISLTIFTPICQLSLKQQSFLKGSVTKLINTKFCKCHKRLAVMALAKVCNDLMTLGRMTANYLWGICTWLEKIEVTKPGVTQRTISTILVGHWIAGTEPTVTMATGLNFVGPHLIHLDGVMEYLHKSVMFFQVMYVWVVLMRQLQCLQWISVKRHGPVTC